LIEVTLSFIGCMSTSLAKVYGVGAGSRRASRIGGGILLSYYSPAGSGWQNVGVGALALALGGY